MRERARAAVARSGLRAVAAEIPMSPTGLKKFLDGSTPYATTFRKLRSWYRTPRADRQAEALHLLTRDLPEPERAAVQELIRVHLDKVRVGMPVEEPEEEVPAPRRERGPKRPSARDVQAAVAHLRVALAVPGLQAQAVESIRAALVEMGDDPDEVTEV